MTSIELNKISLQDRHSPESSCFGCGPKNEKGLRIKSFWQDNGSVTATFIPESHHEAFPGVISGGIIGALLDCHSNWTAAATLMKTQNGEQPPCTVTSDFHVKLLRPTPAGTPLELWAKVTQLGDDRATVEAKLVANGKTCATCVGTFVAVKPGHPAYHRW